MSTTAEQQRERLETELATIERRQAQRRAARLRDETRTLEQQERRLLLRVKIITLAVGRMERMITNLLPPPCSVMDCFTVRMT